jgi:hypothetical protein
VLELRTIIEYGAEPVWTISRHNQVRNVYPDESLALRVVRELARMDHRHAWRVASGVEPILITGNDPSASSVS